MQRAVAQKSVELFQQDRALFFCFLACVSRILLKNQVKSLILFC
jgi:hypothetical protein